VSVVDNSYWNAFYKHGHLVDVPSNFAIFCQQELFDKRRLEIFEAGCGNGRDAQFFNSMGHTVTAFDQSKEVIKANLDKYAHESMLVSYIAGDFVTQLSTYEKQFDVIYSRFSMHAISSAQQDKFLAACYRALKEGGILCVEVRTIHDELYGVGENLGDHAFYSDHYRRFIDPSEFNLYLESSLWETRFINEARGYAPFGDQNPLILRAILEK
jgi:ubiquinone/menaquinone biosynthesis C-methylase UbiE